MAVGLGAAGAYIAANAGAITAVASTAAAVGGIAQGVEGARAARSGRKRQGQAQDRAAAAASSQQRDNQTAQNRANRKKPDIGAILAGARGSGSGIGSTNLTGPAGVPSSQLGIVGGAG